MPAKAAITAALLAALAATFPARADWPAKVFAPYLELDAGDGLQMVDVLAATSQHYFTLAFIIADKKGNPAWGATEPVSTGIHANDIAALRARGGDVLFSFGGAFGRELATTTAHAPALQAKYEAVIQQYNATWLDFDIEGPALAHRSTNHLRNTVLKNLQTAHPTLQISFTVPADPSGLDPDTLDMLKDAHAKGLVIRTINAMTMDFGPTLTATASESDLAIASANAVHAQLAAIDPTIPIGLTPMIGQNDSPEVFTLEDARALLTFANATSWIDHLSFWSIDRDNGSAGTNITANNTYSGIIQNPWDFTTLFQPFSTAPLPSTPVTQTPPTPPSPPPHKPKPAPRSPRGGHS